jgi:thiamine-monophosphate kinase
MGSELERIEMLRGIFGAGAGDPRVALGIGDDAAILAPVGGPLVWTIDAAVEGVHFRREWLSFEDLGFRATMAAASDLAAMGADPVGILAALALPGDVSDDDLRRIAEGQRAAADAVGAPLVGGNLARGGEISIATTALGRATRPLKRSGARPGDALFVAGCLGLAAAGLEMLRRGSSLEDDRARAAVTAWRRPIAQIAAGRRAAQIASAAIDVSDGLARDLGHIARESDVRIEIDPISLVSPELAAAASLLGVSPIGLALHGGEDYALVIAAPEGAVPSFTRIGRCEARSPGSPVIALRDQGGALIPLAERGFDHFVKSPARS